MRREKSEYSVNAVEKAFDILEALTEEKAVTSIPHLAEKLGLSRNKVFRLLATLETRGLVDRDETSGCYNLGLAAAELSQKVLKNVNIIKLAHPVMEKLARQHDEAIYLSVPAGDDILFIDMVDTVQQVKAAPLVGKRFPAFSNAAGKAIRALESFDLLEKLGKRKGRRDLPADVETLENELSQIRQTGVAVDHGGLGDGIISVSVAVRDYAGKAVGALTMIAPSFRMLAERLEKEIIPSLMEGAEILSFKFGYARI